MIGVIAAFALLIPAAVSIASDTFNDVSTGHRHHDDINTILNAEITAGCGGGNYCPSQATTRAQMATFMDKLGALAAHRLPVVNAFMLNDIIYLDDIQGFDLADVGAPSHCETVTFEDDLGFSLPFGSYTLQVQLFDAPTATVGINVQIEDSSAPEDEEDDVYDVCFLRLDGENLDDGEYLLYRQLAVAFEGNVFGAGAQGASIGSLKNPFDDERLR